MEIYRVQDKIISWQKIERTLQKALQLRSRGFSQQEVADRLQIDRTFISRLETIGEIRKGQSIAFIGFPIANKDEIQTLLEKAGVEFIMIMSEQERLDFVNFRSGKELMNEMMDLIAQVRAYTTVILVGSDERLRLLEGILDAQIIAIEIGESPITEDKWLEPTLLQKALRSVKNAR